MCPRAIDDVMCVGRVTERDQNLRPTHPVTPRPRTSMPSMANLCYGPPWRHTLTWGKRWSGVRACSAKRCRLTRVLGEGEEVLAAHTLLRLANLRVASLVPFSSSVPRDLSTESGAKLSMSLHFIRQRADAGRGTRRPATKSYTEANEVKRHRQCRPQSLPSLLAGQTARCGCQTCR